MNDSSSASRLSETIEAIRRRMPSVLRWAGVVAKELREHDIAVESKATGNVNTDALTLADLSLQAMLVTALRDCGSDVTGCAIQAEEETGPLAAFTSQSGLTIAIDPIDGTKQYRDRSGDGYAVMLLLRDDTDVQYSLTYLPAMGEHGHWVEVSTPERTIKSGPDRSEAAAEAVLDDLAPVGARAGGRGVYLIGFRDQDIPRADLVTAAGLKGYGPQQMPGSIYPLLAEGAFCGSLIHTPNVYDFPVSLQIARLLGGDAVRVDTGKRVDFTDLWLDERSGMVRLHGVVACSPEPNVLATLTDIGRDWNPERYPDS